MTTHLRIAAVATLAAGLFAALPASAQSVTADGMRAQAATVAADHKATPGHDDKGKGNKDHDAQGHGHGNGTPGVVSGPRAAAQATADALRARAAGVVASVPNIVPRVMSSRNALEQIVLLRAKAAAETQIRLNKLHAISR